MNAEQIGRELINSVLHMFPPLAEEAPKTTMLNGDFHAIIYWKINNDPNRPNKPSCRIRIIIPHEAINDVHYEQNKDKVKIKFSKFIETKLQNFNPDHNEPVSSPPIEEWLVESIYLN